MSRLLLLAGLFAFLPLGTASAQITFSVDPASAAAMPNDILAPGPATVIPGGALGLTPFDNLNALSFGLDRVDGPALMSDVSFSVDRLAFGLSGTAVESESLASAAAGDVFITTPTASAAILGTNNVAIQESALGLAPGFFGDDLDALDLNGGFAPYFSIDFLSGANGFGTPGTGVANDIFVGSLGALFADGDAFGLDVDDDIDALILRDRGTIGVLDPGIDEAYFSLSTFSPTTFLGSGGIYTPVAHGTPIIPGGVSAADILYTDFLAPITLAASAPSIGLSEFDELNALSNPEPGTLVLMGVGVVGFITIRRRRMKGQAAASC